MKKVITYRIFDLFHYGYLQVLRIEKEVSDYLIIAVSSYEFSQKNVYIMLKNANS